MLNRKRAHSAWLTGAQLLGSGWPQQQEAAAPHFVRAAELDPEMTDAWLGMHATRQQQERAVLAMGRNPRRFGEAQRSSCILLWSRFDIGDYVNYGLGSYAEMWCAVAAAHTARGEHEWAEQAIAYAPADLLPAQFLRGRIAYERGRLEDSIRLFRDVVGKDDYLQVEARLTSARALARIGATAAARGFLKQVLDQSLVPQMWGEAHKILGLIARAEGDDEKAESHFQLAYAEDPEQDGLRELMQSTNTMRVRLGDAGSDTGADAADPGPEETVEDILAELDGQIGQEGIKRQVRALLAQTRAQLARNDAGLEQARLTEHFVFAGPPGTGKTTIARVLARLYKALGILESGHVVEVDRSGMVAGYLGQTVARTKRVIDQAMGGVLFVDEAYALQTEGFGDGDAYGQEAIDTLLKRMEDDRDKLIVIAAGYPEPMRRFLGSNPGLQSRFTTTIRFDAYTADELTEIGVVMARGSGNVLTDEARDALRRVLRDLSERGVLEEPTFGNARYVRNLIEKAARQRDQRLFADEAAAPPDAETLVRLVGADVTAAAEELAG